MEALGGEHPPSHPIEARIPDGKLRHRYLSVLADAIVEANRLDPAQWVVTIDGNIPRLIVGHYITYSAYDLSQGCWIALDADGYRRLMAKGAPGGFYSAWKPDGADQYPKYQDRLQNPISVNGYYDLRVDDSASWNAVEQLSFRFLDKATDPELGRPLTSTSRQAHAAGMLEYMRIELGRNIPDPKP